MRRLFSAFLMPVFLLLAWLMLNMSTSFGQVLLGIVLAFGLIWAAKSLRPLSAQPKRWWSVWRLLRVVVFDIVRSNIAVTRLIWNTDHKMVSGFIDVPLTIKDPHGLAMLACVLTYTPGSVWVEISPDGSHLHMHVLDLKDELDWVRLVRDRYEVHLKEIFE